MILIEALKGLVPAEEIPFRLSILDKDLDLTYPVIYEERDGKRQKTVCRSLFGLAGEALVVASVSWGTYPDDNSIETVDWSLMLYPLEHLVAIRRKVKVLKGVCSVFDTQRTVDLQFSAASGLGTVTLPIIEGRHFWESTKLTEELLYRHASQLRGRTPTSLRLNSPLNR